MDDIRNGGQRQWITPLKLQKKKPKIFFKNEDEIKAFAGRQKLRESVSGRPVL